MAHYVGTSGFAFKEWKGPFYPDKLPDKDMLTFYASRFSTVELNNTFYRMPREKNLLEWAAKVPDGFRFAVKAPQWITHHRQLQDVDSLVTGFREAIAVLGARLGPTLFQLPPVLKRDLPRLEAFLASIPRQWRIAFEFRHKSWLEDDATLEALRARDVALCISDQDDLATPVIATASWGYVRLHKLDYDEAALDGWAGRLRAMPWSDGYIYFKHDHSPGSGPPVAEALIRMLA